jgi:glycosyltransferase involved in cell wall biosynthesis
VIPNIAHFVFGLGDTEEPFHPLHYVAIESCRRVLAPERIYFHYRHLPFGPYWDEIAPFLTLHQVELSPEVLGADYSPRLVPPGFRYAHHADFVRLDALIEHGGVYADIDTVFLRPFPRALFDHPFVIGREPPVRDERTGIIRPSLCNALLMSEPGSAFARTWREQMAGAMNGTWSNHSGFLSERLSREMPDSVSVTPQSLFFPFEANCKGLVDLLERGVEPVPDEALSVHLWAHLWWDHRRLDTSRAHGGWCTPAVLRHAPTTLAEMVRPYLPDPRPPTGRTGVSTTRWRYLSLDERSGYGVAGDRCRTALEESGLEVDWFPFVPGRSWGLGYEPAFPLAGRGGTDAAGHKRPDDDVVVAHLVPEYLPLVRRALPGPFLVGHTVWETDRLPGHWATCLDHADLIVVPSRFAQRAMSEAGLAAAVEVVPHAATDLGAAADDRWLDVDEDVFVFYTIAEWNERKAVGHTIEAFLRAFRSSDRVTLVVKTSPRDHRHPATPTGRLGPGTAAFAVARLVAGHPDPPSIRLVTRELSDAEVVGLHRRGDCFLSLCRSEGWGLGAFDAATHANPVVTTGFGGHLDYLGTSPFLVGYDLVPVAEGVHSSYTPDQRWAEPHVDHASVLCRRIADDPESARSWAAALAEQLRAAYHPTEVARAFRAVVGRHRGEPAAR